MSPTRHSPEAGADASDPAPADTLPRLLELERTLEAEVERARTEAEQRVEAVRRETRDASASTEADDARALDDLRRRVGSEVEERLHRIGTEAEEAASRYRGVDESEREALARWVAGEVIGGDAGR